MSSKRTPALLFAAGMLGAGNALAAAAQLPPEHHQGSVAFLTGGVGKDETQAFKRAEARFPLALEFVDRAGKRDEFTAGTKVSVADRHGRQVLSTVADGPFLLARLPAGRYTVTATYEGKTIKRPVAVDAKGGHPFVFEWRLPS